MKALEQSELPDSIPDLPKLLELPQLSQFPQLP